MAAGDIVTLRAVLTRGSWVLTLAAAIAAGMLSVAGRGQGARPLAEIVLLMLIPIVYSTVGLVVANRAPGNRIGSILLVAGLLFGVNQLGEQYPEFAVSSGLPLAVPAAWLSQAVFFPALFMLVAVPVLFFPDGRLPSRRWRWVGGGVALTMLLLGLDMATEPGLNSLDGAPNPLGVDTLHAGEPMGSGVPFLVMLGFTFLGPAAAIVVRFRRSAGVERQQLKWFAYAASLAGIALTAFFVWERVFQGDTGAVESGGQVIVLLILILTLPVAIGLAIVRYRLYEVDRLISRTISYGILVGVLVAVYGGGFFLLGTLLPFEDNLAVALSTLAVAGLFNPLRRRVQTTIDRRFFRSSYDARQVVEQFSTRLRDQVDLDVLTTELLDAVDETMKPTSANVWLRETP